MLGIEYVALCRDLFSFVQSPEFLCGTSETRVNDDPFIDLGYP